MYAKNEEPMNCVLVSHNIPLFLKIVLSPSRGLQRILKGYLARIPWSVNLLDIVKVAVVFLVEVDEVIAECIKEVHLVEIVVTPNKNLVHEGEVVVMGSMDLVEEGFTVVVMASEGDIASGLGHFHSSHLGSMVPDQLATLLAIA
jgi:hypothetical protein